MEIKILRYKERGHAPLTLKEIIKTIPFEYTDMQLLIEGEGVITYRCCSKNRLRKILELYNVLYTGLFISPYYSEVIISAKDQKGK